MQALTMQTAVRTDVGRRPNNEDSVFATSRLVAVADGVGGASAGEVASQTVIDAMAALDARRLSRQLSEEFSDAIRHANQTLGFLISCRPGLTGMATTLTAVALANDGTYLVANVGDSRTYLFRDHGLRQLTRDQSYVQLLLEAGAITTEQAREHPQRSVVLDALDGRDRGSPEIGRYQARAGDRLLLCSDGLSDVVSDTEIAALLEEPSRELAADRLIAAALQAGGQDNVSALVADLTMRADARAGWLGALPPRAFRRH